MAVVTPDGIVGKVIASYPTASQVLLITDPDFAAGVVTEKGQVHGTLKGQGTPQCKVDYVPFEEKVEPGEWVYTSGDDRIFPRGFKVGIVKAVRPGQPFKEIVVDPSGLQRGLVEDVLILIEGVHQPIPEAPSGMQPVYMTPPLPGSETQPADAAVPATLGTEADRLRTQYKALGDEQKHTYGDNPPGTKPVDFTKLGSPSGATGQAPAPAAGRGALAPPAASPSAAPRASPPKSAPAGPSAAPNRGAVSPTGTPRVAPSKEPSASPSKSLPAGPPPLPNNGGVSPSGTPKVSPSTEPPASPSKSVPTGPFPEPSKSAVPPPTTPKTTPSTTPPASSPKTVPALSPATPKNSPSPSGAPAKNPSDATRRSNQSAGGPPGGQPR